MRRSLPAERLAGLGDGVRGLTSEEAADRARRFGRNQILERSTVSWRKIVGAAARDPMLWFLVASGTLYVAVGERTEAVVLWLAILPIVSMDLFLHRRTQASLAGLRERLAVRAAVIRDGAPCEIDPVALVPGDLVVLRPGDHLPADGLFVRGSDLQVDESALTGESFPVRKRPWRRGAEIQGAPDVEGLSWGLAGTQLLTGSEAALRVVHTGAETLYGEIVRLAVVGAGERTPLQRAMGRLVAVLTGAAGALCVALAAVRLRQGHGWVDSLVSAATLAVAALPEEFPIVFTFFLGVGVHRLAMRRALVRRAVSVENVGRATTLLCDKTGTITTGKLRLSDVLPAAGTTADDLLCIADSASRHAGDPLDSAIGDALLERRIEARAAESLAVFPFTEVRRRETVIARDAAGRTSARLKGAAETVLAACDLDAGEAAEWRARVEDLAGCGRKVIACAAVGLDSYAEGDGEPDRGFVFAGLLAFEDPVRAGVGEAVETCRAAGIHPVLVTGDHPAAARAVAREIGFGEGRPVVLTGDEMERRIAAGELGRIDAVARATPAQKLALVRALRRRGECVVVTGDGVNDVPALQAADVGVAMGERGTRSAREIASIVLLDDDFGTLVHAIAEGRQLFRNLRASFEYLVLIHAPLVTTAAIVPLLGHPLLYLPVHVVWLELVIHPTAMLVFQELPPPGRLDRVRRRAPERFFSGGEWARLALISAVASLLLALGYVRALGATGDVEHARAMGMTFLLAWGAGVTAALSGLRTRISRWGALLPLLLSIAAVEFPPTAAVLHVRPLHPDDLVLALAGGAIAAILVRIGLRGAR